MGFATIFSRMAVKADLIEEMMAAVGVRGEFARTANGPQALREATLRCMSCSKPGACAAWLSEHHVAAEAPAFCRNHDLFARMREATHSLDG